MRDNEKAKVLEYECLFVKSSKTQMNVGIDPTTPYKKEY